MGTNIYFASDFHLGAPDKVASRQREKCIVEWLKSIQSDCSELYLMGDVFDFWFEYASVIPKGFVRLQGQLAAMADAGIRISFFKGNHDMWVNDYFTEEIGLSIISDELIIERDGKRFYMHHGDGLGPGDKKYKFLRKVFRNSFCQWLFSVLPPRIGLFVANGWSGKSRIASNKKEEFLGNDQEWLAVYAKDILRSQHFDYFIFGHRHLPLDIDLGNGSRYINLGEWINYRSYAVYNGIDLQLKYYPAAAR